MGTRGERRVAYVHMVSRKSAIPSGLTGKVLLEIVGSQRVAFRFPYEQDPTQCLPV